MLKEKIAKAAANAFRKTKIHSPEIAIGVGIAATVVGFIGIAVGATKNANDIRETVKRIKEKQKEINGYSDALKEGIEDDEKADFDELVKAAKLDKKKDILRLIRCVLSSYVLPSLSEGLGVFLIFSGYAITRKRLSVALSTCLSLAAAGTETMNKSNDIEKELIEDGSNKKCSSVRYADDCLYILFDEMNPRWSKDRKANVDFLRSVENNFNMASEGPGFIDANTIVQFFGYPPLKELLGKGKFIGKKYSDMTDKPYLDFGLRRSNDKVRRFLDGSEPAIFLEIPLDGDIYDIVAGDADYGVHYIAQENGLVNDDIPTYFKSDS
jgi:hypothetical protein